ncbi:hypothetical protein [Actinoplanes sp. TFC3]|uniref:hypothetical protein n=1 Tax=Actinoplanes sp. TFC3 TaxID=1710355 RepID=UPI0008364CE7|nr:hypothetical protein [Actinoplanes sp. TFC3]
MLLLSGATFVVLAAGGFGLRVAMRVLIAAFAVLYFGYAVFLVLFFDGGALRVFYLAFLLPVVAVIRTVKAWRELQAREGTPGVMRF